MPQDRTPAQLNATDDLHDQVKLLKLLREEGCRVAIEARSDKLVTQIFRGEIRPERGPSCLSDMVYFWSGYSDTNNDRWQGPGVIGLFDRDDNAHVKYEGKVYIRSQDLLKHFSQQGSRCDPNTFQRHDWATSNNDCCHYLQVS